MDKFFYEYEYENNSAHILPYPLKAKIATHPQPTIGIDINSKNASNAATATLQSEIQESRS
jgi:hypothetical protein